MRRVRALKYIVRIAGDILSKRLNARKTFELKECRICQGMLELLGSKITRRFTQCFDHLMAPRNNHRTRNAGFQYAKTRIYSLTGPGNYPAGFYSSSKYFVAVVLGWVFEVVESFCKPPRYLKLHAVAPGGPPEGQCKYEDLSHDL